MSNLATGHGIYKAAIPIGATLNMNTFNRTLTVMEPAVSSAITYVLILISTYLKWSQHEFILLRIH